jgi:hypothetical protein
MAGLKDYKRVIGAAQLLYLAGKSLKRQGVKYTVAAMLIALAVIFADTIGGLFDRSLLNNPSQAFLLPAAAAILTFGLGNAMVGFSNLFSSEKILLADANAMNLMEDRKKADVEYHLDVLWDRVFKYEAQLYQAAEPSAPGENAPNSNNPAVREKMAATKEEFIQAAGYALRHNLPQKLEMARTGCNLALVEDWYDGAFFTLNDNKLKEQFAAHRAIRGIRKKVGLSTWTRLREALSGHPDPVWFSLTTKKVGMNVGILIDKLNQKHVKPTEPSYFNAQDFLWKHPDADELIFAHFPENPQLVKEELHAARKKMMRSIFSHSSSQAHQQIFRMFGRDFINAFRLRLDYDVDFAAGRLDYSPLDDIAEMDKQMDQPIYPIDKLRRKISVARENIAAADSFLSQHLGHILQQPRALRAARVGYHINRGKIQSLIRENPDKAIGVFNNEIIPAQNRYSHRICLLRQHYELSRIQLFSYVKMVDELADY